jgi:uncharacterized protein YbjQ (UPF0145 family)
MLTSTTAVLQDKTIEKYLGVISSEVILGANVFRDFSAGIRDFFGGRSNSYEEVFDKAKTEALKEIIQKAEELGANGVIGIAYNFSNLGANGSMLMVAISGTAVRIKD